MVGLPASDSFNLLRPSVDVANEYVRSLLFDLSHLAYLPLVAIFRISEENKVPHFQLLLLAHCE